MSSVLHHSIVVADPPADAITIVASDRDKAALSEEYGLQAVKGLTATLEVSPISGGVAVDGHVTADIVQTCVVSLVPVDEHIDETFSVRFVQNLRTHRQADEEVLLDAAAPDPPEALEGPTLDLGALAEEYFALAINPYPRAPGAELPPEAADPSDASDSPFAALARLAKPPRARG